MATHGTRDRARPARRMLRLEASGRRPGQSAKRRLVDAVKGKRLVEWEKKIGLDGGR